MMLILIQFLKILLQEMPKGGLLQGTKALYFYFDVIIMAIVSSFFTLLLYFMSYIYNFMICTIYYNFSVQRALIFLLPQVRALIIIEPALSVGWQRNHTVGPTLVGGKGQQ